MTRRANLIVEACIGLALMTAVVVALGQTSVLVQHRLQASRYQRVAGMTAANVLERVSAVPWSRLTQDALDRWELPPDLPRILPGAQLQVSVSEPPDDLAAKRVAVTVSWSGANAGRASQVQLVAWRFRGGEVDTP